MSEEQRWRLWIGFVAGSMTAGLAGFFVAVATGSRTAVVLAIGWIALAFAVMVVVSLRARRHPDVLVPPHLHGIDVGRRRLVTEAVKHGGPVADRRLAPVAVAHARNHQIAMGLYLASASIGLYLRFASLSDGPANAVVDLLGIGFWLVTGAFAARHLVRARRAAAANTAQHG